MPSICVEDMVALAMVHGELGFELAHDSAAIGAPQVRTLRELITVVRDPELERLQPRGRGAKVVITTKDGRRHDQFVEHPRGHALRGGVGWPELFEKWDRLLTDRLTEERYASFKGMCSSLEAVEDIAELMAPLEGRRS
jgi:2-methylcitrate dehydratase PrpD